jgi:putative colanic acid biosysnthesis UDP-glucose lipid carrier transferase
MINNKKTFHIFRLFTDLLFLSIAFVLAGGFAQSFGRLFANQDMLLLLLLLNLLWSLSSNITHLYDEYSTRSDVNYLSKLSKNIAIQMLFSLLFLFMTKEGLFTRVFFLSYTTLLVVLIASKSFLLNAVVRFYRRRGEFARNVIIIGMGPIGQSFYHDILKVPQFGFRVLGYLDKVSVECDDLPHLGDIDRLDAVLAAHSTHEVVITLANASNQRLLEITQVCNRYAVRVQIVPDYSNLVATRFRISHIGEFPILTLRDVPLDEFHRRAMKRSVDLALGILSVVFLFSWLFPIIILLQKLTSKGPAFFRQERIGINSKIFSCFKFRTMEIDHCRSDSFVATEENQQHFTPIGGFLRKSNMDELPQIFNILKGEMSLVGPRPHPVAFQKHYKTYFESINVRHVIKPGLTGLAQTKGFRGDDKDEEKNKKLLEERFKYDNWYIENWSLSLDFKIIGVTILQMLTLKNNGK